MTKIADRIKALSHPNLKGHTSSRFWEEDKITWQFVLGLTATGDQLMLV